MAWNEPGGNNGKDPWGNDQGPPDLDEAFRKFKKKFTNANGGGSDNGSSGGDIPEFSGKIVAAVLGVIAVIWAVMGFYTVDQQEQAVVLRFGKYYETVQAGLKWNPPLVDKVMKVNVTKVRSSRVSGLMMTLDENIVEISLSTQYTVSDPKAFLLEVRDPERSVIHAAESALRHAVGSATLDQILTEGRAAISIEIQQRLQRYLDMYHTGIQVTTVNIEDAQPPSEVQAAFDDVIRAKEDEARLKNEAETYKKRIVPEARGLAKRQYEEAEAYKTRVVANAQGEAERFTKLLTEYKKAPEVTRQRLYIDAMQNVLSNSSKVMVDVDGGNLMYLPLDQLMKNSNQPSSQALEQMLKSGLQQANQASPKNRNTQRNYGRKSGREGRYE